MKLDIKVECLENQVAQLKLALNEICKQFNDYVSDKKTI